MRHFFLSVLIIFLFSLVFSGCSSAPKKQNEIFTERNTAENQLNLANRTANRGFLEDALVIMEDARRLALSTDDPSLRIRTLISRGSILFSLGRQSEAFADWENAASEADASGEKVLASLARIYAIRGSVIQLAGGEASAASADECRENLAREMNIVKNDAFATAVGYVTLGMTEKESGRWAEAESAVKKALDFHVKNLSLEEAAYDWFIIASIRSMAGNYDSALEALGSAISYDRRAENGFGLASSWHASGEVYQKAGRDEEARAAFRRAAEIYRALGHVKYAEQLEKY